MTHRQFDAWQEWLGLQWNLPSRSDHYGMQVAQKLEAVLAYLGLSPHKDGVKLDDMKIPFVSSKEQGSIDPKNLPPDDPYSPKRLRTKEDVEKAQEKISKAMMQYRLGLLK